jgi:hypothetical protein
MLSRRTFLEGAVSAVLISKIFDLEGALKLSKAEVEERGDGWFQEKIIQASRVIKNENERQKFLVTILQSILTFSAQVMVFYFKDKHGYETKKCQALE